MAGSESTIGALLDETGGSIKTGPFGTKLKAAEYTATGVPVISVGEVGFGRLRVHHDTPRVDETVSSRMPEFLLKAGDIVFGRKGAVERSAQVQPDEDGYFLGSDGIRIRLNVDECDPKFISYQLQTTAHRSWMIQHAAGTTMPSLNEGIIRRIPIVLKPLAEQKAIAAVLGALDDKIELNRRMNATLEAMARALFQSWFVDFDPVRAKLDGRPPAALDPATAALFPDSFQDSEVGRIPAGWTVRSLSEVIDLGSGVPYEAKFKGESGLPMITLGCVSFHDRFQDKGLTYYSGSYKESHVVQTDDLVVASHDVTQERKQLGSPAMVPRWLKGSTILAATNLYVVRNNSKFPNQYLYQLFRAEGFRQQMVASAKGTAILFISKDSILRHRLAWPSEELASRFSAEAEALYSQYAINAAQSRTLATLRDTLLPKLLSGELSVAG
jgi:type I restriction enzyme S subunit